MACSHILKHVHSKYNVNWRLILFKGLATNDIWHSQISLMVFFRNVCVLLFYLIDYFDL